MTSNKEDYDVIIIGAGLSGLVCADTMLSKLPSLRVLVLEANDRCGGRTKSVKLPSSGVIVDEGGMWLGKTHEIMLGLCKRFDVKLVDQYCEGRDVIISREGERFLGSAQGDFPGMGLIARLDMKYVFYRELYRLMHEISDTEPWAHPKAFELDSYSLDGYFRRYVWTNLSLDLLNDLSKAIIGCESSQVSCLFALWSIKSSGGLDYVLNCKDGAQEYRMLGGAQQVSEGLKTAIESHRGCKVLFNHRASEVLEIDSQVQVKVPNSDIVFTCKELVVSGNASVLIRELSFTPRLPALKEHFAQRTFRGSYGKALVVFKQPIWREKGLSGSLLNSLPNAFASSVLDYCLPSEYEFYALACFLSGDAGILAAGMTESERKNGILSDLAIMLGESLEVIQSNVIDYCEYLWHQDPIAQGCSGVIYGPGHFCPFAAAKVFKPEDDYEKRVHFVGTDVSFVYPGYMEGACRTGSETALRIVMKIQGK